MFKNLLVPATGGPDDAAVHATALLVARTFAAHLEFLHVRVDTTEVLMSMTAGGVGGGDAVQAVIDRMEVDAARHAEAARASVESLLSGAGIALRDTPGGDGPSGEFTLQQGSRSAWVAQLGRFADLIVMGRGDTEDGAADALEAALMDTGKPLLIAPAAAPASFGTRVVIAWKDTPEAARAVAAALPFITRAEQVTIITVADDATTPDASMERLRRALRWHNPAVSARTLPLVGGSAVELLQREAMAVSADLVVMGGYSHSRLRQVVFGGVTRSTLAASSIAVLMAH